MIDIDQTTKDLQVIHRGHLFGQLCNMSKSELKTLKKDIKDHQKKSKFIPDSTFKPDGSAHDAFIAMVNNALLKRSIWNFNYSASFLIKKSFNWLIGLTLEKHPYLGTCRKYRDRKFLRRIKRFWLSHFKWIIGTLIAISALIFTILKYIAVTKKIP